MQRTLLSMLLANANAPVSVDLLCGILWGESVDARAGARLQLLVHRLRGALGHADRIEFGPLGYRLRIGIAELDADRFDTLARELADTGPDPMAAVARARSALELWETNRAPYPR